MLKLWLFDVCYSFDIWILSFVINGLDYTTFDLTCEFN